MSSLIRLETAPDLVEQVYQRLLDAISDGSMAPGTRLTQETVAEQLAVSRQPVLQALRQLKADGLVQDAVAPNGQKGRGVVVAPLSLSLITQVYQVRSSLDALAARLAAERRARLDPGLIEAGRHAAAGTDIKAMIDADLAFHRAMYAASGNPLIDASALLHWCHVRRAMGEALQVSRLRTSVWDEHQAMADAVVRGDADTAVALMLTHGQHAAANLNRQLGARLGIQTDQPINSVVP